MWILCCIQWRVSLRQWWERYRFLRLVKPGPLQLDCVVSSDIPGFLAMLTCCPAGRLCQHSLPHSCSPFAHCFWAKMSSVLLYIPREIYPQPIAWGGPVTEVSAQALACMSAPQCSAAQGRVAQACVDTAVGKICICKSLSAKLGSFRHPIAFDQPARVVIHSFFTEGYVYVVFFEWMWATFAHFPSCLAACRWRPWPNWEAGSWSLKTCTTPLWDSPGLPQHLAVISQLQARPDATLLPLTSANFPQSSAVMPCTLGTWASRSTAPIVLWSELGKLSHWAPCAPGLYIHGKVFETLSALPTSGSNWYHRV